MTLISRMLHLLIVLGKKAIKIIIINSTGLDK